MATSRGKPQLARKVSVSNSDFNIPPVPVDVAFVRQSGSEDVVGWVAACLLVALMLPLLGMLYLDVLETKHETKRQQEVMQRLINKQKGKDGQPTQPTEKRSP